jgi:uncharacterized coiled-coil DUF342 family protein
MTDYDLAAINLRLNNQEKLIARYTERWDHETKSQYEAIESLKKEVATLKARSIEDAAKIGELRVQIGALSESIEKARKAFTELKKNG